MYFFIITKRTNQSLRARITNPRYRCGGKSARSGKSFCGVVHHKRLEGTAGLAPENSNVNRQSLSSYLRRFLLRRNDNIGVALRFKGLSRSVGTLLRNKSFLRNYIKSSGGTDYIVGMDFNPFYTSKIANLCRTTREDFSCVEMTILGLLCVSRINPETSGPRYKINHSCAIL